jgi:hypothetical protein
MHRDMQQVELPLPDPVFSLSLSVFLCLCLCLSLSLSSVELAISCVEESKRLSTPLAVAGGMVCVSIASGDLQILAMSQNIKQFAGHARLVSELLPESFRDAHSRLVGDLLKRGASPSSTLHPLQVRLVGRDNRLQDATIRLTRLVRENSFLVVIVLSGDGGCADIEMRQDEVACVRACVCVCVCASERARS